MRINNEKRKLACCMESILVTNGNYAIPYIYICLHRKEYQLNKSDIK